MRVELHTAVGVATIFAPSESLSAEAVASGGTLSLEAFVGALVDSALAAHDASGNGKLERDEFVAFATANPFLSLWFGHLASTEKPTAASWKDDFQVS